MKNVIIIYLSLTTILVSCSTNNNSEQDKPNAQLYYTGNIENDKLFEDRKMASVEAPKVIEIKEITPPKRPKKTKKKNSS